MDPKLPQPQDLDISFLVPSIVPNGQIYTLPDDPGATASISFFQLRPPTNGRPHADIVASVLFPNLEFLKQFAADLQMQIEQHEKREK
jgi:hypothetical protein